MTVILHCLCQANDSGQVHQTDEPYRKCKESISWKIITWFIILVLQHADAALVSFCVLDPGHNVDGNGTVPHTSPSNITHSLVCSAMSDIWKLIHGIAHSPYMGPIDWSPVSTMFYFLSIVKGAAVVAFFLITIVLIQTVVATLLTHVLLCSLLCIMILENKLVSPYVVDLRIQYHFVKVINATLLVASSIT